MRLATRGSALALVQAGLARQALLDVHPDLAVDLLEVSTRGDGLVDVSLEAAEGIGFFTDALEVALDEGEADLAVHSLKDLPTDIPPRFALAAVLPREDPRDVLVSRHGGLDDLPRGARVGTDSARRRAQLALRRPDLDFQPVRGNVPTRLRKLDAGEFDALVLAAAGLQRLGLTDRLGHPLEPEVCLPAPGQGAIVLEALAQGEWLELARPVSDASTVAAVTAERACLAALGGGCQSAMGALATVAGDRLTLEALLVDAGRALRVVVEGSSGRPAACGEEAAARLLKLRDG
ncbi:MAG TPA: hydroxymethylbilane synthase [Candidatus Dormibacteraeota bacterium]